ncbi:MAG: dienelactone hydrolase family protein [Alphaproteobacteria bacterium]
MNAVRAAACSLGFAVALAMLAGGGPAVAYELATSWPDADVAMGFTALDVTFPSHSPFAVADVGGGPDDDPATQTQARLVLPPGASAAKPVPAVVLLHGASGVLEVREMTYARQFAALGVAALVVDVYGARRDHADDFIGRLLAITEAMFLADAFAALDHLAGRPEIDARRVALIGFSYGGIVATLAAFEQVAERYAPDGTRFAAHVAFYAPCLATFEDARATGAPLLMLYGGRDASVDAGRCAEVADQITAGGGRVETVVYPEAVHQWDGRFDGPRPIGRNLAECRLEVERDGTVRDTLTHLPMSNGLFRRIILALCTDGDGYLIGHDDTVRARSNLDMGRFLAAVFAGP